MWQIRKTSKSTFHDITPAIKQDEFIKYKYDAPKARSGSGRKALVAISHTLLKRSYGLLKSGKMYSLQIPLSQSASPNPYFSCKKQLWANQLINLDFSFLKVWIFLI